MRKLVIAIDCDDVLVPSTHTIVDIYNQHYGTSVSYERAHESGNEGWGVSRDEAKGRIHSVLLSKEYSLIEPFPEAVNTARELVASGHELHMVTARDGKLLQVTEVMLERYFDKNVFTSLEHVGFDGAKGDICRRLGADVLIDDNLYHLVHAAERGVDNLFWFGSYPWQGNETASDSIAVTRCEDWSQVLEEINKIAGK